MKLVKIVNKDLADFNGSMATEWFNFLPGALEPYARKIPSLNREEIKYAIPSVQGAEVSYTFEMVGRSVTLGNPDAYGPGSQTQVHCEGTPHLKIKLSYLETTNPEEVEEIKRIISSARSPEDIPKGRDK